MFLRDLLRRPMIAMLCIAALSAAAFADTLRLKDGSIIKGRIVGFSGGTFTVLVGEGSRERRLSFDAGEVESIEFDAVSRQATAANSPKDVSPSAGPEYIETSGPPKTVPRVITTDPIAESKASTKPPPVASPPVRVMEPAARTGGRPIEISVKVMADNTANGWTNSGWVVKKGQKIRIIGDGSISLGSGVTTGPSGLYEREDPSKLLKSVPTGALIAVIGDDNNEFIYVGSERTFTAARDGALFLGVNEGNLNDNSGSFEVRIEIQPA